MKLQSERERERERGGGEGGWREAVSGRQFIYQPNDSPSHSRFYIGNCEKRERERKKKKAANGATIVCSCCSKDPWVPYTYIY